MNDSCFKQNGERVEEEQVEYQFIMRNRIFKIRLRRVKIHLLILRHYYNKLEMMPN